MNLAPRHPRRFPLPLAASLVLALVAAAVDSPARAAAPNQRRLQLTIDYVRQAGAQQGADRGRATLTQRLELSALLHSDGTPSPNNPLDPEDGRRQLERAQRSQQRMQDALARQGRSSAPMAAPADMQAMQARAAQMQAKCGTDRDCLMREAMAMSAAQVARGDTSVQARLQGYGDAVRACERSHKAAAAREACIADARRQAGGGTDDGPPDEVVETPYLHFSGRAACGLDVTTKIDERIEGSFDDVQGVVPFTQTTQAGQSLRDDSACPLVQAVLDTRSGRLWTAIGMAMRDAPGVMVRSEKGRAPQRHEGRYGLRWHEADGWMTQRLSNLNAGGEAQARLPAGTGQVEVRMRWRFDPA